MKAWWKRQPMWRKIVYIVVTSFAALLVIGSALPPPAGHAPAAAAPAPTHSTAAPVALHDPASQQVMPPEPVSQAVCTKVQAAWQPYSVTGGSKNASPADELALANRVWNLAQEIPANEVYVGTSQTPGLKLALDVWGQEVRIMGEGGQASDSTIRQEAQTVENDCATLGVGNVWGLAS